MRVILLVFLLGLPLGCQKGSAGRDAGAAASQGTPLPPGLRAPSTGVASGPVHEKPTKGAKSPRALAQALLKAAQAGDGQAFVELTASGRDVALFFHPAVQPALRQVLGGLMKKFTLYAQQLGRSDTFVGFEAGLSVDFQRGHGARVKMPGLLRSKLSLKSGSLTRSFPIHRIVRIEGRWKILDL